MKIFCKDLEREIDKKECLPDRSSVACKTCPEKNNKSNTPFKPKDIADLYLKSPKLLPVILRPIMPEIKAYAILKKYISTKTLNILKKYHKDRIHQVCQALYTFYDAIFFLKEDYNTLLKTKNIYKRVKAGIKAVDTLLDISFLSMMEIMFLNDIKERLIRYGKTTPVTYNPLDFLWCAYMPTGVFNDYLESVPIKMSIGSPGEPLFKTLQIVIYKLLDTKTDKKQTERITANLINDYFENCADNMPTPIRKLKLKKLTPKDINNALHSS